MFSFILIGLGITLIMDGFKADIIRELKDIKSDIMDELENNS